MEFTKSLNHPLSHSAICAAEEDLPVDVVTVDPVPYLPYDEKKVCKMNVVSYTQIFLIINSLCGVLQLTWKCVYGSVQARYYNYRNYVDMAHE